MNMARAAVGCNTSSCGQGVLLARTPAASASLFKGFTMSRHNKGGSGGKKRKPQAVTARGSRDAGQPTKKVRRTNDMYYEAMDSDPDEEKHAERYDHVDNYEYELPSDFEDEEIDDEAAFTAEDKKLYAGWFGDEGDQQDGLSSEDEGKGLQRRSKRAQMGEFADLESSSDEEQEDEGDKGEVMFGDADEGEEGGEGDGFLAEGDSDGGGPAGGSDDDVMAAAGGSSGDGGSSEGEDEDEDEDEEALDDERHRAMLAAVLGRQPGDTAAASGGGGEGRRRKGLGAAARNAAVVAEAYPESEAHAGAGGGGDGDSELRLSDLMAAATAATAAGSAGAATGSLRNARKLLEQLERRAAPLSVPLPRTVAERVERQAGYEDTKKDVTKWQPIVKANREAPTIRFTAASNEVSAAAASTAALVDGFTPNTDDPEGLEAQVAALLGAAGSLTAHAMAEADEALAPKKFTAEEAAERAARLSKMRHLLFYAELKAKRLAKIKSKEYHRRQNKAAKRAAARAGAAGGDEEEEARLAAEEAEFDRAQERLTLKHRNSSKWARRALKQGHAALDPTTREAIGAQLALGQQLRRRIEGKRGDDSGNDEGGSGGSTSASEGSGDEATPQGTTKPGGLMSSRSRQEALAILKGLAHPAAAAADGSSGLQGTAAGPDGSQGPPAAKKGLFALPFMVRALEKQRAAAAAQAAAMLEGMGPDDDAAAAALDDFGVGSTAAVNGAGDSHRLRFSGAGPVAAAQQRGGGVSGDSSGSGSDGEEDVDAKAARLQRHMAGEAAAADDAAAAIDRAAEAAVAKAAQQQKQGSTPQRQRQQQQRQSGPDVGYVEVDLPHTGAAAGKKAAAAAAAAVGGAAGGGAAADAAAAAGVGQRTHAGLFGAQQRRSKQGADDDEQPGPSQPAAFVAARVWQGARPGYVFKRDKKGLGYYLDSQPSAPAAGVGGADAAGGGKQKQQKRGAQKQLLQRQQQELDSSSDEEDARQQPDSKQQQRQQQQKAAGAAGAMQLLSNEAELNRQLLQAAFAGDDVEAAFAADKAAEVEEELPSAEVGGQLPGWGTWSNQQKEPGWMVAAKAKAAAQRAAAAASRQDAGLKHVVISEKWDKKAAKYHTASLPFPFNDKQVYEAAMRQPLGRQYNPNAAFRNLTRPAVLKTTGVVIEPARFSKGVEQYNTSGSGRGRAVVTIAGGLQLEGQAAGSGAGGVGKGLPAKKKKQLVKQRQQQKAGGGSGGRKAQRLHEAMS